MLSSSRLPCKDNSAKRIKHWMIFGSIIMNKVFDTHTFLWFWWDNPLLGSRAKNVIGDPANRKLVSFVSYWEVAIKLSQKNLI